MDSIYLLILAAYITPCLAFVVVSSVQVPIQDLKFQDNRDRVSALRIIFPRTIVNFEIKVG